MEIKHRYGHIRWRPGKKGDSFNYINTKPKISLTFPPGTPRSTIQKQVDKVEAMIDSQKIFGISHGLGERNTNSIRLQELSELYINDPVRNRDFSKFTLRNAKMAVYSFINFTGNRTASELINDSSFVNKYIEYLLKKRAAKNENGEILQCNRRSVNGTLIAIKAWFNWCQRNEHISEAPKVEKVRLSKNKVERYILTSEQMNKISARLYDETWLAFQLFRYTLARRGSICRYVTRDTSGLKWGHVNFNRETVQLTAKGKTDEIPLHPILIPLLVEAKRKAYNDDQHVIAALSGTVAVNINNVMRELNLYVKGNSLHLLRRSSASEMLAQGGNIKVISEILMHSSILMTELYTIVSMEDKRKTIAKL